MTAYVGNSGGDGTYVFPAITMDSSGFPLKRGVLIGGTLVDYAQDATLVFDDLNVSVICEIIVGEAVQWSAHIPVTIPDGTHNAVLMRHDVDGMAWRRLPVPVQVHGTYVPPEPEAGPPVITAVTTALAGAPVYLTGTNLRGVYGLNGYLLTSTNDYIGLPNIAGGQYADGLSSTLYVPTFVAPGTYTLYLSNQQGEGSHSLTVAAPAGSGGGGGTSGGSGVAPGPVTYPPLPSIPGLPLLIAPDAEPFLPLPSAPHDPLALGPGPFTYVPLAYGPGGLTTPGVTYAGLPNPPGSGAPIPGLSSYLGIAALWQESMVPTSMPLYANGVDLHSLAASVQAFTGRFRLPGRVGSNGVVNARNGAFWVSKRFGEGSVSLSLGVRNWAPDGNYTFDQRAQFLANLRGIVGVFSQDRVRLVQWVPLGLNDNQSVGRWVTCLCELTGGLDVAIEGALQSGTFDVELVNSDAFWRDLVPMPAAPPGQVLENVVLGHTVQMTPPTDQGDSVSVYGGYLADSNVEVDGLTVTIQGPGAYYGVACGDRGGFTYVGPRLETGDTLVVNTADFTIRRNGARVPATDMRATNPLWFTYVPGEFIRVFQYVQPDLSHPELHHAEPGIRVTIAGPRAWATP